MVVRIFAIVAFVALICVPGYSAENGQKPAADVPELEPLGNFVGKWDSESTLKTGENAEAVPLKGKATSKWIHSGRFLRQTWSVDAGESFPAFNGSSLRTYDPQKKVYRAWSFDSNGTAEESEGSWNADRRTLELTAKNALGGTSVVTSTFPEDGKETWRILVKDRNGNVVADVNGTNKRRAK